MARQLFDLAEGTATAGVPTTVIVPSGQGMERLAASYSVVPHLTVNITSLIRFDTLTQSPIDVLRLLLPYRRVPILHLHTGDVCLPRVTLAALDLLRPRHTLVTVHSAEADMLPTSSRARYWATVASRAMQRVICPSAHGKRTQIGYGLPPERVTTIYNGIDNATYSTGRGEEIRNTLGIGPDAPLLLFASRFHAQKRPLDAIAVFARLAERFPHLHFAMVGSGPMEADVRAAVATLPTGKERVYLPGYRTDIADWLAAATVYLLPTQRENFSLSVIEALASGCPVVSTLCQGNDEILVPGDNALTATVDDIPDLADKVALLLCDTAHRIKIGQAGRRTAANFSRKKMVERHLALYRAVNPALAVPAAAEELL